jgi:hypothetical protein
MLRTRWTGAIGCSNEHISSLYPSLVDDEPESK